MKIWMFSDLHLEGCDWSPSVRPEFDVLVAAGDIHDPGHLAIPWLQEVSRGKPVIYVPGNHEWYAHKHAFTVEEETEKLVERSKDTNVNVLMDDNVVIGDVRFLGSTLWTDFAINGNAEGAMAYAAVGMNDHRVIYTKAIGNRMQPVESRSWHFASRAWLESELPRKGAWSRTVVVTHHLPHPKSIDPRYRGSPLNPAFASDLSGLVEGSGADLWIHGHTHSSVNYQAGSTRVVCNPKGYGPNGRWITHENTQFREDLVIEV